MYHVSSAFGWGEAFHPLGFEVLIYDFTMLNCLCTLLKFRQGFD